MTSFSAWTDPAVIQLSPDASEMLTREAEKIEPRMAPGADLAHITDWAAKLNGTTARISALLHIAEYPWGEAVRRPVGEDTMARAIAVGGYFTSHAGALASAARTAARLVG